MNAADQRRLTPILAMACAILVAGVAVVASGFGNRVDWGKEGPAPKPAAVTQAAKPVARVQPLSHYAAVWQKPLFNPDRKPAPESGGSGSARVSIGDLELTGIMLTPDVRVALLHDRRSGRDVRVREGESLPESAWTLRELKPRGAVFEQAGQRTELVLKVPDAPPAGPAPESKSAPPAGKGAAVKSAGPATSGSAPIPLKRAGNKPAPAFQDNASQRRARLQALKARIEERRRQMQARQHGDR